MSPRAIRLTVATGALVAAAAPFGSTGAQAMVCPPPVVSTVCWAHGVACQYVPHGPKYDFHMYLCTVVM